MPSDLADLVSFLHHGNTQIRQVAVENLVPYSLSQAAIFKTEQFLPIKDLKLLVRDYPQIAKNVLTILINLSSDREILEVLATDDDFLKVLLTRVTNPKESTANEIAMLFANLAKWDEFKRILNYNISPPPELKSNPLAINQLLDLFVRGAENAYNKDADFDYLAFLFADIATYSEGRRYFTTKQEYDGVIPLTKLTVFTEHKSDIRRKGVASTIKNVAFEVPRHRSFFSTEEINIMPYLLLPITGNEEYDEEDTLDMLSDLQLLPPDKSRDKDPTIVQTHLETLMLLTTTREGRDHMREIKVYPIVRETHLHIENDDVREACERLVQVLMRDEENDEKVDTGMKRLTRNGVDSDTKPQPKMQAMGGAGSWAKQDESEDEEEDDDEIVEV